jgi:signal transduction histidine kinase
MATEMRKTGVDVVGDIPWGTHFCLFYETRADLLETLVSYCKAGLENQEFCLWVVAEPLTGEDARHALKRAVPDLDQHLADQSIEIVAARDWYLQDGTFDLNKVISGWNEKLARASARGYAGVRVTGDTAWLEKKDWKDFCEYEDALNQAIAGQRLAVLCTYPLTACGAAEILDVVRTHQFAVTKRRGNWDVIETAGHKQAKAEIKRLNAELEQRVLERTSQLTAVNRELTKEVLERQRAEEALLRSEAYLAEAQSVSHTGSFGWDVSSGRIFWSEETFRILEYDMTIQPTVELIFRRTHPGDRELLQQILDRASETRADFEFEHRLLMPDGSVKHIHVMARALKASSGNLEFVGAVTDVTAAKRTEEELRRLSGQLLRLQDEERRRIARDLHDSTGQNLVALATMLGQLRHSIPSGERKSCRLFSDCKALADRCIREVRTLSYLLHPPILDQAGLGDAICDYVKGFTTRSGIKVELELSPHLGRVERDIELALFRVVQESLANIQRHSRSQRAKIRIDSNSDLTLQISDHGPGVSSIVMGRKEKPRFEPGVGIPSMEERVKLIGGRFEIDSTNHGTTVRVTIPLGGERA